MAPLSAAWHHRLAVLSQRKQGALLKIKRAPFLPMRTYVSVGLLPTEDQR